MAPAGGRPTGPEALGRRAMARELARQTVALREQVAAGEASTAAAGDSGQPRVRWCELPGPLAIPLIDQGPAGGVPVVLLHGLPLSGRSFEPLLSHLADGLRVLVPDQRGHGGASRPAGGYGFGDYAGDLAALLDRLGIERAVIAGHSMGSLVAQRFAVDHPERTLGLVLVSSALTGQAGLDDLDPSTRAVVDAVATLSDPVDAEFVRGYIAAGMPESQRPAGLAPALLAALDSQSLEVPARAWRELWRGILDDDLAPELARVEAPALIVWGERDPLCTRAEQDALVATLPQSRLEVYEGAGHVPFWDRPARFATDLAGFAREAITTRRS